MAGQGTGYPSFFRCFRARREMTGRGWHVAPESLRHRMKRTGRTKAAPSPGKGDARKLDRSYEYVCSCGHRGWSYISGVERLPLQSIQARAGL